MAPVSHSQSEEPNLSQINYIAEIAHNLHTSLDALDMLGLSAAAAFVDLALRQIEIERSKSGKFATNLAQFGDPRFATMDAMASEFR